MDTSFRIQIEENININKVITYQFYYLVLLMPNNIQCNNIPLSSPTSESTDEIRVVQYIRMELNLFKTNGLWPGMNFLSHYYDDFLTFHVFSFNLYLCDSR